MPRPSDHRPEDFLPHPSTSAALDRVLARFANLLRAVGRRRGLDDGDLDELVQDVRVRLWRALGEGEKIQSAATSYVYRTAMAAALDIVRRRRVRREEPLEMAGGGGVALTAVARERSDRDLESHELAACIDRAIGELPEAREVVVRLHLSGYDRFEIARMLGWSEPKVRNLIYRGLGDLRELLRREGIGPLGVK